MDSFNAAKTAALIAYLAYRVDIGKTKLMKLLYLIDFTMYERYSCAITYDTYRNLPFGIVPMKTFRKHFTFLSDLVDIEVMEAESYTKYTAKGIPALKGFTSSETEVIENVIEKYGRKSQEELVKMVHEEPLWKFTKTGERIPYYLAPLRSGIPALTQEERCAIEEDKGFIASIADGFAEFMNPNGTLNFG